MYTTSASTTFVIEEYLVAIASLNLGILRISNEVLCNFGIEVI